MKLFDKIVRFFSRKTTEDKPVVVPVIKTPKQNPKPVVKGVKKLPEVPGIKFGLKEVNFKEFTAGLRPHQMRSIEAVRGTSIGQINIPTGTGKTYIQKHILTEDMIEKTKADRMGVYVIAAHRLVLCTQLFNEVLDLTIRCGIKADMVYLGSDKYNFSKLKHEHRSTGFAVANIDGESTTSGKKVVEFVNAAKTKGHHVIIVSTYHSLHRLHKLNCIDIITFDEAHTTTSELFTKNIQKIKKIIKRQYFFTATRRIIGEEEGQANTKFYGEVLYKMSPKEAMGKGEMVQPYIHEISIDGKIDDLDNINTVMAVKTVKEAFTNHKEKIKSGSCAREKIGGKLLVTVDGLTELHSVHEDKGFREWCEENSIRTFAFSSDKGEFVNFSKSNSRQKALEAMGALSSSKDAIFFHYDILTEGIDLPAITGVLLLRDLTKIKLLQNIGRATRLLGEDRRKIYSGEILPNEYSKMIKPYCLVVIPKYTAVNYDHTAKMVKNLREIDKMPITYAEDTDKAIADVEDFVPVVTEKEKEKDRMEYILEHEFEDIVMEDPDSKITTALLEGIIRRCTS